MDQNPTLNLNNYSTCVPSFIIRNCAKTIFLFKPMSKIIDVIGTFDGEEQKQDANYKNWLEK
jgi:hypothetical protein